MKYRLSEPESKPEVQAKRRSRGRMRMEQAIPVAAPVRRERPARPIWKPAQSRKGPSRRTLAEAQAEGRRLPVRERQALAQSRLARAVVARWWALLLLGLVVAAIVFVSVDSRFFVYDAKIMGAHYLKAAAIYKAAGINEQNIFWIRPSKVAEAVKKVVGVKDVQVHCSLPAVVNIEVKEREPAVMWIVRPLGQAWWIDAEGIVLPYRGNEKSSKAVFVEDSTNRSLKVGTQLEPAGVIQSVQQLAVGLTGANHFYYQADRGLSFTQQADGAQWPVFVGTSSDLPNKIQAVEVITKYLAEKRIRPTYVDVRWAKWPVYGLPGAPDAQATP